MPKPIIWFVRGVTAVNRAVFLVASALMLVIIPVMLYAVTMRYLFNAPASWASELATLMFGPYFLLGGPYLLHIKGHVNLDLVQRAAPAGVNRALELVNHLVIIAFAVILLFYAWPFALQSYAYGETSYSSWNPAIWPVKFFIPIALILLALQALAEWLRVLFLSEEERAAAHTDIDDSYDEVD